MYWSMFQQVKREVYIRDVPMELQLGGTNHIKCLDNNKTLFKKASSKCGVYKFLVFSEFQFVIAYLDRFSMIKSLYLYSRK